MPSNPMQRKVRNSFLLGIFTMLIIVLLIGAIVFLLVLKPKMDKEKQEATIEYVKVCKLTDNIKSGDEITEDVVTQVDLPKADVPADAMTTLPEPEDEDEKIKIIAKVNLAKGTVLSENLITEDESELENSARVIEYNMIALPLGLEIGDIIDIRIAFANGQDLIIVSKKRVQNIEGDTFAVNLTEGEILMMNSAIVEAFVLPSARLHITKYTEPGKQEASVLTYVPTQEVQNLIASDRNITDTARTALTGRFINGLREGYIETQLSQYAEERKLNIETGVQQQIQKARSARENYLSGMSEE